MQLRLLVNCPSGESRLLQMEDSVSVFELKQTLQEAEGIPAEQQVLCHAGLHLKDHLALSDHRLDAFTLSDEIVLYLTRQLSNPLRIYLTPRHRPSQIIAEQVETDSLIKSVKGLLESRCLATSFSPTSRVFAKRQDGTTIQITINASEALGAVQTRISKQENVTVTSMTFQQAQDGALHIIVFPSVEASTATYPVYLRENKPQRRMERQTGGPARLLGALGQELCVLP